MQDCFDFLFAFLDFKECEIAGSCSIACIAHRAGKVVGCLLRADSALGSHHRRRDEYGRSHSRAGRAGDARRRAPPISIVAHPPALRPAARRPLSAADLECSPLAPTDTSDTNYALKTPRHSSKFRPAPTLAPVHRRPCRSLINPRPRSHSVQIPATRAVRAARKNKLFVTIKMVNQTNFSNCEVKL
ncbi:unnamed protein product [Leptidea sinapis]|uniref:Uncharacterized protein n=1 Tax=Leptidea sinapis TaxID=189913 RepID=A0A5E4QSG0_9NEOP|nr:unnamed protein product [Leptidea sinapis]